MKKSFGNLVKVGVIAAALGMSSQAHSVAVDLELGLLVDASSSVNASEFALQRDAYAAAFQSGTIQTAIASGAIGAIAVNYVYWSSAGNQQEAVGWTLIDSAASANAFGAAVSATTRPFGGQTAPGNAIAFEAPLFNNGFDGTRNVIDVSGDGAQNNGISTAAARNAALAGGIDAINGIVIGGSASVLSFYQNNVQGGANSFTLTANSFNDFAGALNTKLIREITNVPTPMTPLLALIGLGALAITRRRKQTA